MLEQTQQRLGMEKDTFYGNRISQEDKNKNYR